MATGTGTEFESSSDSSESTSTNHNDIEMQPLSHQNDRDPSTRAMIGRSLVPTNETPSTTVTIENSESMAALQQKLLHLVKHSSLDEFKEALEQSDQVDINYQYDEGTLLHIACDNKILNWKCNNHDLLRTLLEHKADVNAPNTNQFDETPLHTAVKNSHVVSVKILLKNGCDVNKTTSFGDSALHYAVIKLSDCRIALDHNSNPDMVLPKPNRYEGSALNCMQNLLQHELINVNIQNQKGFKPLELATHMVLPLGINALIHHPQTVINAHACKQITDIYPQLGNKIYEIRGREISVEGASVVTFDSERHDGIATSLQYACLYNQYKEVDKLLKMGLDPNKYCPNTTLTPLMIAAQYGHYETLRNLLDYHEKISFEPVGQKTALHSLFYGMLKEKKSSSCGMLEAKIQIDADKNKRYFECLELLVDPKFRKKLDINYVDSDGKTALHLATRLGDEKFVLKLLGFNGAQIGRKNQMGEVPLTSFSPSMLKTVLDSCISCNFKPFYEDDYEIYIYYDFFTPRKEKKFGIDQVIEGYMSEVEVLLTMNDTPELKNLLTHPVFQSYLDIKWQTVEKYYWLNMVFFIIFCISLITYIFSNSNYGSAIGVFSWYTTILFNLVLFLRELFQFYVSPASYFKSVENWLETSLICAAMALLFSPLSVEWYRQLSSTAVILCSIEVMLLFGRHPLCSTYIEMFNKVSKNFIYFVLWYLLLLVGFGLGFFILFKDNTDKDTDPLFTNPIASMIKCIFMLAGELDVGSIPLPPFELKFLFTYVIFVSYVFFGTIIIFNLLNGLAVSDIQTIRAESKILGVISRAKLIFYIESVLNKDPLKILKFMGDALRFGSMKLRLYYDVKFKKRTYLKELFEKDVLSIYNRVTVRPNNGKIAFSTNDANFLSHSKEAAVQKYCHKIDSNIIQKVKNLKTQKELMMEEFENSLDLFNIKLNDLHDSLDFLKEIVCQINQNTSKYKTYKRKKVVCKKITNNL